MYKSKVFKIGEPDELNGKENAVFNGKDFVSSLKTIYIIPQEVPSLKTQLKVFRQFIFDVDKEVLTNSVRDLWNITNEIFQRYWDGVEPIDREDIDRFIKEIMIKRIRAGKIGRAVWDCSSEIYREFPIFLPKGFRKLKELGVIPSDEALKSRAKRLKIKLAKNGGRFTKIEM